VLIFASKDLGHPLTDLREVFNVWWRIIKSASNSYLFFDKESHFVAILHFMKLYPKRQ